MDDTDPTRAHVVGAAIVDDLHHPTTLLAARRTEPAALAGGWELPGGKVEPDEDHIEALHRELAEELGVEVRLGRPVGGPMEGAWPLGERYVMFVWLAQVVSGEPLPLEDHDELRVLGRHELGDVAWLPADRPIVEAVAELMG